MNTTKQVSARELQPHFPSLEQMQQELGRAKSIDDFFGKDGIFARLFAQTLETLSGYPGHAQEMDNAHSELG